ncbi:polysaccharide pyruvyl transferase family protein [Porifericola rhodea]|uniref:polysaccharide pyruvyl transferase family protein n=1 Tax=Porifericola rhodea TaxID=930972 RepID=UPI002666A68D|nr:polysaccharide pyruvyl transferase family protein [Porifericola rhodea]WKN33493.1 polysaccharide pyruvyl transferase family protein [Porifericola rhodea]
MKIPGKKYIPFKESLKQIRALWHDYRALRDLKKQDNSRLQHHQKNPEKPTVINMNANDICNSKCTMCNIWQQKKGFEVSPQDLEKILDDSLYSEVRGVGITGGEPTLREDLADLYEACCKKLPSLRGLSIITNAIIEKDVINRIHQVIEVCDRYEKNFSMMVSLDGYGVTHDKVRGREGNFDTAINVINHFRNETDVPVAIGCTISKVNVWEVDELLDFLKEEGIYGRFRIAEYIKRLYNEDRGEVIRTFDEEETYHLMCFFKKVELTFEKNPTYKRTYKSIINILGGGKRLIACPYQANGVVLNSRGDLHYCAPKSQKIGNGLEQSSLDIYNENLIERKRIINDDCDSCIHDYHAPITYKEALISFKESFWQKNISLRNIHRAHYFKLPIALLKHKLPGKKGTYKVLITGWYGTETVGDKAILGSIIDYYKEKYSNIEFYISSVYPFITEKTCKELQVQAYIVSTKDLSFSLACAQCDEIVMGGGPLMGINALSVPLWAFKIAKQFNRKTIIFGCGVGPLKEQQHINAVKKMFQIATTIKVRDNASFEYAKKLSNRTDIENIGDPAREYIRKVSTKIKTESKKNILACFLREWTSEYMGDKNHDEFLKTKEAFEANLAKYIQETCLKHDLTPVFYPMHTFVVGNDDRDFNRKFAKKYFQDFEHVIHKYNTSVDFTVKAMQASKINLCMRFHSVLFAHTLETDFIAIDYTNGGKITGYLTDHNALDKMISLHDLAEGFNLNSPV